MSEPFVGEVRLLPYTFAPRDWALCNGQLLPISQNSLLFSLLGTMYGGNGTSNFALPNLQGAVVVGAGSAPGLQTWDPGTEDGADSIIVLETNMPTHTHTLNGVDVVGSGGVPTATDYLAQDRRQGSGNIDFLTPGETAVDASMDPRALSPFGNTEPHENRQPFVALNYCIALAGIFPSRP